jgi:serine/threonine protein kinase
MYPESDDEPVPTALDVDDLGGSHSDEPPAYTGGDLIQSLLATIDPKLMIPFRDLTFISKLGQGAYGVVFKGRWRKTRVAIKHATVISIDRESLAAFVRESKLMIELPPHPNVVQVLGVSMHESNIYIVMEVRYFMISTPQKVPQAHRRTVSKLCTHGSLQSLLEREDPPSLEDRLIYISSFSHGVMHLHENNIIHRDLASRNILIGAGGISKISEFVPA